MTEAMSTSTIAPIRLPESTTMPHRRTTELPTLCNPVIHRPALLAKLDAWRTYRATFVHAPAGYGKTTLVLSWLPQSAAPHAWLTCDEAEREPLAFVRTLADAMDELAPGAADCVAPHTSDARAALYALLEHLARVDEMLLVLDDAQRLASSESAPLLKLLFERAPQQIHFLVLSRHSVEPALVRVMMAGVMQILSSADLRFDAVATMQLFTAQDRTASDDVIARALTTTEGWALALHIQSAGNDLAAQRQSAHDWITEYFNSEVLHPLAQPMHDFLMRISVLEEFDDALCAAVTDSSQASTLLPKAIVAGLFLESVPVAAATHRLRMHPLLRAHLLAELRSRHTASEIDRLHLHAAHHLAETGAALAAVRHLRIC